MSDSTSYNENENLSNEEIVKKALEELDMEFTSDQMAEYLMDPEWTTYKMFEDLASDYLNGSEEYRKGIDCACAALTGWNLYSLAEQMLSKAKEHEL